MNRLLWTSGHEWVRDLAEVREFVELEAAALPCRPYASFDASGHPRYGVTQEVGPWMARLDMEGPHGGYVVPESAVSSLFKEGSHGDDVLD